MHVNVSCRSIFPNNIINYKSSVVFIVGQNYNTKQCEMWDTMCVCVCGYQVNLSCVSGLHVYFDIQYTSYSNIYFRKA